MTNGRRFFFAALAWIARRTREGARRRCGCWTRSRGSRPRSFPSCRRTSTFRRIADQICLWEEGKCLIFDDTYNHEVWNDTEGYRVVLLVDFARPMKTPFRWLNDRVLNMATLAPFIREAKGKQAKWEKKMYADRAKG